MNHPVVIIGAGAAGLATARELARRAVSYRLLERGGSAGQTWHDLYDSLTLHTGRHLSALPGMRMPRHTPLFPTRLHYYEYLRAYAHRFGISVETQRAVTNVMRTDSARWLITAGSEHIAARAVVVATGIVANPLLPDIPGRDAFEASGRSILHSIHYQRPGPFLDKRVLVVGIGNSGGEIGSELARAGVDITIAVRSGAHVVPLSLLGIPIQYLSVLVRKLPRRMQEHAVAAVGRMAERRRGPPVLPRPAHSPLDAIPLIGFNLVDEIRAGNVRVRPGITRFTETGVLFTDGVTEDFDAVILATGFRPALSFLHDLVRHDQRGFALRADRVTSADHPGLFFVGHNYDARGGLLNIALDAPLVAERIVALQS